MSSGGTRETERRPEETGEALEFPDGPAVEDLQVDEGARKCVMCLSLYVYS